MSRIDELYEAAQKAREFHRDTRITDERRLKRGDHVQTKETPHRLGEVTAVQGDLVTVCWDEACPTEEAIEMRDLVLIETSDSWMAGDAYGVLKDNFYAPTRDLICAADPQTVMALVEVYRAAKAQDEQVRDTTEYDEEKALRLAWATRQAIEKVEALDGR